MEFIFRHFLSVLVIWTCFFSCVLCCVGFSPKYGNMTKDQELEVGSQFSVTCSLFNNTLVENGTEYFVTSENLILKFGNTHLKNVRILDPFSVEYTVENATVNDTGIYNCFVAVPELDNNQFVCTTHVAVGFKPLPVRNFSCVSLRYEVLNCTWIKPFNPVYTKYTLKDYLLRLPAYTRRCPVPTDTSCTWRLDTKPPYRQLSETLNFIMFGQNSLGNFTEHIKINHFKIVKPGRPANMQFSNVTKNSLHVHWLPPKGMEFGGFPPGLDYWLHYCPVFGPMKFCKVLNSKNETSAIVKDLLPNIEYAFKLRCRSSVTDNEDMWSPYLNASMKTLSDVPYLAPVVSKSSFEVSNEQENRSITLFWKPIPYWCENGENFQYVIHYQLHYTYSRVKREYSVVEVGNNTMYTFKHMDMHSAFLFRIYAQNAVGTSTNYSVIEIDKDNKLLHGPRDIAVLALGSGKYKISWKSSSSVSKYNQNYALFWCRSIRPRPFKCKGPLDWLYTNETNIIVQLLDTDTNYQFAVSAYSNNSSSGLKWASCVVPVSGVLYKVKDVRLRPKTATSLSVELILDCDAQKDIIEKYAISYCEIRNQSCIRGERTVILKNEGKTDYIVSSLHPYTRYKVTVRAATANGWSENSIARFESTLPTAPSDSPQNVRVIDVNDTIIRIHFQPPTMPNGIVTRYVIQYGKTTSSDDEKRKIDYNIENSVAIAAYEYEYEIENGVFYYTNYSIQVQACVAAACSPFSDSVYAFTGIGYPGPVEQPHIQVVNVSLVNITWKPPDMPNGPIDMYVVTYAFQNRDDDITQEIYNISGKEHSALIDISCPPDPTDGILYYFKVQALNIKNGSVLYGLPSEFAQTRLCLLPEGMDARLIAGLSVGVSIGFVALVFIIYSSIKWFKKKIHEIEGIKVELPDGLNSPAEVSYDKFENGLQKNNVDSGIPSIYDYEKSGPFITTKDFKEFGNIYNHSAIPLKKSNREKNGRNHSGESIDSGKVHDSIGSSNTSKTHVSIDSGAEMDLPPSPDGMFSDSSSTNTTPRSYKPDLAIVEENTTSGSKDSGLEKEGLAKTLSNVPGKSVDIVPKFTWYVKKTHPYANLQLQKHVRQVPAYSKFAVISPPVQPYVSVGMQNFNLLDQQSLSNSEPSVADFEGDNDSEPLMFDGAPPYCKFGLARSAGNGLNFIRQSLPISQNAGYSKFGIIYKAFRRESSEQIDNTSAHLPKISNAVYPEVIQNVVVMPFQVVMPMDDALKNRYLNNNKNKNKIHSEEKAIQKPSSSGYVSFHDILNNPNENEIEKKNNTGLPDLAYSKFSLNPNTENHEINVNSETCIPTALNSSFDLLEMNDTVADTVSVGIEEPTNIHPPKPKSYVSFQDAKSMSSCNPHFVETPVRENESNSLEKNELNLFPEIMYDENVENKAKNEPSKENFCSDAVVDDDSKVNLNNKNNLTDSTSGSLIDTPVHLNSELMNTNLSVQSANAANESSVNCLSDTDAGSNENMPQSGIVNFPIEFSNNRDDILPNGVTCGNLEDSDETVEINPVNKHKPVSNGYVAWSELTNATAKDVNNTDVVVLPKAANLNSEKV